MKSGKLVAGVNRCMSGKLQPLYRCRTCRHATAVSAGDATGEREVRLSGARQSNSFALNLFRGQLEIAQVFPFPDPLSDDQRQVLKEFVPPLERFFEEVNDPVKNDSTARIDDKTLPRLWELGAFALQVPTEFGGLGLSNMQYARMAEIVGANDLSIAVILGAHQGIGFKGILLFGNPQQKQKYFPRVSGGQYAAFCLTEPSSGSDAGSIKTRAVLSPDGKHFILNGSKIWISNGGFAEIMTVFAQTSIEKNGKTVDKVTAFIVERAFGGVTSGPPEEKMGIKSSNTAEVYFEDVRVPIENVLGGVGNGFKVAMTVLNSGRFSIAALLAGTQRMALRQAAEHAATRVQFGNKIMEFGTIQEKLARMAMFQYVTESLAYIVSGNMDSGAADYHLEAAISKVFASDSAWIVVDEAIQILGGMGYMKATGLERVLRDLRIFRIFEGTNDVLRLFVALTGLQFAGSHLRELQRAFKNPTAHLGLIFSEAGRRAGRAVGLPLAPRGQALAPLVPDALRGEARELAGCVAAFGETVEAVLRQHGKDVVERQFVLNRLAAAAVDVYTTAAAVSRAARAARLQLPAAEREAQLAAAWAAEALGRVPALLAAARAPAPGHFERLADLGSAVAGAGGQLTPNPLGF